MGQQLIGRPVSQRSSFGTLNTPSSPFAPVMPGPQVQTPQPSTAFPQPNPRPTNPLVPGRERQPPITIGGFQGMRQWQGFNRYF